VSYMLKVWSSQPSADVLAWADKYFGVDGPPPNLREVDEAEIAQRSPFLTYTPNATDFRQFVVPAANGAPEHVSMTLFLYYDQTGVGLVRDYWAKRIRWFRCGCAHTYIEESRPAGNRSGEHVDRCTKCGFRRCYDTSD
jgi:hypothetical protein